MQTRTVDVLVIGAGPAGTLAAAMLRKAGLHVEIVEKQRFPRFVIGESLLPRIMDHLDAAGLLDAVRARGFQEKEGARFYQDGVLQEYHFADQHTPGWSWTWQVPRAEFDQTLADAVREAGVPVHYEQSVEGIDLSGEEGVRLLLRDAAGADCEFRARFVIDASGYGRVLPRLLDLDSPSDFPMRRAFFAHFRDENRPDDRSARQISIIRRPNVWVWVIPFSDGRSSVGLVAEPEFFAGRGEDEAAFRQMVSELPELRERFGEQVPLSMAPRSIAGYSTKVKQYFGDRFVLAGNATEFLDPVLSSGVMFAAESGRLAGELVARQLTGGSPVDWQRDYVDYMQSGIDVFRTYVSAWYNGDLPAVFFAKKQNLTVKNYICSILAGYVWDRTNPYVVHHRRAISALAALIRCSEDIVPEALTI